MHEAFPISDIGPEWVARCTECGALVEAVSFVESGAPTLLLAAAGYLVCVTHPCLHRRGYTARKRTGWEALAGLIEEAERLTAQVGLPYAVDMTDQHETPIPNEPCFHDGDGDRSDCGRLARCSDCGDVFPVERAEP